MAHRRQSGNGSHTSHRPGIGRRVEEIGSSAQHLLSEAKGAVEDLRETFDFRQRVERHPYGMLFAAAAVGYVLGGGLFTSWTGGLVRLGIRLAAVPFVKNELMNVAEAAFGGLGARDDGGAGKASEGSDPGSEGGG
ncbi:MAG TPA: hypothetical protein VF947_00255 [Myxococcales bacterium]